MSTPKHPGHPPASPSSLADLEAIVPRDEALKHCGKMLDVLYELEQPGWQMCSEPGEARERAA